VTNEDIQTSDLSS